ncbi:MAG: CHAD domain-containing protein [Bryobacterales bacterium]|nr:CHAD domain-containing protein [Bryobacterales bacterium]
MKRLEGRWRPEESCLANAHRELPRFARAYFSAGRKAARKRSSFAELHEFRLATKHFRYLLELFQPLFGTRLDEPLKQLRQVQTLLGELNDYETTRQLICAQKSPEASGLRAYLDRMSRAKSREFRKYWTDAFDADGEASGWQEMLSRVARSAGKPRSKSRSQVVSAATQRLPKGLRKATRSSEPVT